MLTREVIGATLIAAVLLIALFIFMRVQKRKISQESVLEAPSQAQEGVRLFQCLYVATVFESSPLERVWAYGLGNRGKAEVAASDSGIGLLRQGERGFLIPYSSIVSIARQSATIDKGVEARGLVQIHWKLGEQELLTNLRITTDQEFNLEKLKQIVSGRS